jgi:hypothetical protein
MFSGITPAITSTLRCWAESMAEHGQRAARVNSTLQESQPVTMADLGINQSQVSPLAADGGPWPDAGADLRSRRTPPAHLSPSSQLR